MKVYSFQIQATATDTIQFQDHTGSSLRGSFINALANQFCRNPERQHCDHCPLMENCPVISLVAPEDASYRRIRYVPRPFAIRPPLGQQRQLRGGDRFVFGLTIFGSRLDLFPYIILGLRAMGNEGIGKRTSDNRWERGHFVINQVQLINRITGERQEVMTQENPQMTFPDLATSWADAQARAARLSIDKLTLHFLTPLRLTENKQEVKKPELRPLVLRLLERHDFLSRAYSPSEGTESFDEEVRRQAIEQADAIELVHDETQWTEVQSYSQRQKQKMPVSGLTGSATYRGDFQILLPLLLWGTIIQVGKGTTKGNGVYEVVL